MKKKNQTPNVEFGSEFGDINAAKHYEVPLMNKDKKHVSKKKQNKKK
jgi:hypothetical protein